MKKQLLYIANWKMQKSYTQVTEFIGAYSQRLESFANMPQVELALAPSFESLAFVAQECAAFSLKLCAQDCSIFENGPYTGQVSPRSLADIGCSYCIIGHSESRLYGHQSDADVAEKMHRLISVGITPIICIGEQLNDYTQKNTSAILKCQLMPIFALLNQLKSTQVPILIAYEPVWAIGSGITPEIDYLGIVFTQLQEWSMQISGTTFKFMYGGSVHAGNIGKITSIPQISGLLIGSASLQIADLEGIILAR